VLATPSGDTVSLTSVSAAREISQESERARERGREAGREGEREGGRERGRERDCMRKQGPERGRGDRHIHGSASAARLCGCVSVFWREGLSFETFLLLLLLLARSRSESTSQFTG